MKELLKRYMPLFMVKWLRIIYDFIISCFRTIQYTYLSLICYRRYKSILKKLRNKEKIKVAFFAIHSSVWKYDYLYRLMVEHSKFEPIIVVCPAVNYGMDNMLSEMDKCYNMFHSRGYNVVRTYISETHEYLDVKKEINPDIIFYTNPYKGLIDDRYYITNFLHTLTCYVPYSACICSIDSQYKKEMHYLVWRFFVENPVSYKLACRLMLNCGRNTLPVGYPLMDETLSPNYVPSDVWKHNQKIKIIWAPHHSFDANCGIHFSNFFEVSDVMVDIAQRYVHDIQIAFKPHPLLYAKLLEVWGKEKTDTYFNQWATMENTQYEPNEYLDLFMSSDAMIFDSVSFIYEYLFTRNRSLFIYGKGVDEQLNEFGKEALSCHQLAYSIKDIYVFIESLLKGDPDPLLTKKESYYQSNILPMNASTASEAILNEIVNQTK